MFGSVPLVLTFVNEPAAIRYECQNRDTNPQLSSLAARSASAFHQDQQAPSRVDSGAAPDRWRRTAGPLDCRVPIIVPMRFVFARNLIPLLRKGFASPRSRFVTDAGEIWGQRLSNPSTDSSLGV